MTDEQHEEQTIERRRFETVADLEAMLHRAARHGARDALREIGLGDSNAGEDIAELRDWLGNMRGVRRAFRETTVKVFTGAFWLILAGGIIQYIREHLK